MVEEGNTKSILIQVLEFIMYLELVIIVLMLMTGCTLQKYPHSETEVFMNSNMTRPVNSTRPEIWWTIQ